MPSRVGQLVGDPRIQIGIWLVELRAYIDVDGHPISLTAQGRGVTRMNDADGLPAAVLVHDPRIAIDPRLAPGDHDDRTAVGVHGARSEQRESARPSP